MGKTGKILAWQLTKVKNKNEVIAEARNEGKTVHFASLMDLCDLKNSDLEPQYQKFKGRVVLRGDTVKDLLQPHFETLMTLGMSSGPFQAISFTVITWNPYVPKEEPFPIPLQYIDVTRNTHTSLCNAGEKHRRLLERYGDRDLSDTWTGFTTFTILKEK